MAGYGQEANEFALVPPTPRGSARARSFLICAGRATNQQLVQNRALIAVEDAVEFRRNRVSVSPELKSPPFSGPSSSSLGHDPRHHCRNPHQCAIGDGGRDVCLFNGSGDVSCSPNGLRSSVWLGRLHPAFNSLSRGDAGVTARTEIEPPRFVRRWIAALLPRLHRASARATVRAGARASGRVRRCWLCPPRARLR